jgi:hypothetical protein
MISMERDVARNVRRPVIKMACAAAVVLGCAATGWTQTSFQSSGQTAVFTLTPGAKAGPEAVLHGVVVRPAKGNSVTIGLVKGGIVVTFPTLRHGLGDITIYDMSGRQAFRQHGFAGASLRLDARRFAPGMYNVIVRIDGQKYSRRIAVSR